MMAESLLDLTGLESYRESCLEIAGHRLSGFQNMAGIAEAENDLNAYPRLDRLSEPKDVWIMEESIEPRDLEKARRAVLEGHIFWEHTAAGEATRLKLGTKFLIDPARDLMPVSRIAERLSEDTGENVSVDEVRNQLDLEPGQLLPLTLGERHLLQQAFDISRLAEESGLDPAGVLAKQKILLVLNEKTAEEIIALVGKTRFAGFNREHFLFMIQPAFHGIDLRDGVFLFDQDSDKRLHNHGQLVMQETMDGQLFRLDESGNREYLGSSETAEYLEESLDKISYNIEDLDYLTGSLDWDSLALALRLGAKGYDMIMEIVANNPKRPQKGGLAAYDEVLEKNVMIESFQLKGMPNEDLAFLNKNFNHYTNPVKSWRALKENGLPMPITVKGGRLYFQPVQGDINFLVRTAFVQRRNLRPIKAWKSAANTISAVNSMNAQDIQPGFQTFITSIYGWNISSSPS